jgi:pyocin large subunit-like protein
MAGVSKIASLALALSGAALLAACDNGPSAVASQPAAAGAQTQVASADAPARRSYDAPSGVDHRKDPVKLLDGKPEWAASRRYSAAESAQHAYDRNGEAFGATSLEDYVRKARAFVEHPPKGVETLSRPNGDTLYYDAQTNVFAVADKSGAPRTMFKPDDGASYWQEQKDRQARADRRTHKSNADDDA